MKRLGIVVLFTAVCLWLSACGTESLPVATTAPEQVIEAAKTKNKVSVAREESFDYTDANGNSYSAVYRIPSINFDSEDAEKANSEITQRYSTDFATAERESAGRLSLTCDSLNYEKFENDGVISVVIRRVYFSHAVDYTVYNFNSKTGAALSNDALAKKAGMSAEAALKKLSSELEKDYVSKYKTAKPERYEENLGKTLADENLAEARYYLGKDGKLTAICKEFASVGTGEFSVVLSLN
ncbi:MAG: hypothetical protein IJ598_13105 [Ruminococcus sp.]|nr:hypothetical protein [Ruminococcus sp.]